MEEVVKMKKTKIFELKEYEDNTLSFFYQPDNWDNAHVFLLNFLGDVGFKDKKVVNELDVYLGDIKNGLFYFFENGYNSSLFFCDKFIYMVLRSETTEHKKHAEKVIREYFEE